MLSKISSASQGRVYQHLINNFCLQYYLCKPVNPAYKKYITRFRLSSHNLNIEQGHYRNENRRNYVLYAIIMI